MRIVARGSPLSRAQVEEIRCQLPLPEPTWIDTQGDKDQASSLVDKEKTNFFTKELDDYLLAGKADAAIHSAKDLPDPLPKGLSLVALTRCISPHDLLVTKKPLASLKNGAYIGTSSTRRQAAIHSLRQDLKCVDIRGTIDKRISLIEEGIIDGAVIAEAALLRLGIDNVYTTPLAGQPAALQGRLAVVARTEDLETAAFFSPLHREILYLGSTPPSSFMYHCPLLRIAKKENLTPAMPINNYSHIIFTSKHAVEIFMTNYTAEQLKIKTIYAIGKTTANTARKYSLEVHGMPIIASQEGMIELLESISLENSSFLLPRSSLARECIDAYLQKRGIPFCAYPIYDTIAEPPKVAPLWERIDEVYFTSPSTVDACARFFPHVFKDPALTLTPIGPITEKALQKAMTIQYYKNRACQSSF